MSTIKKLKSWDLFISCPCDPLPLKSFYESDMEQWLRSFEGEYAAGYWRFDLNA